MNAIEWFLFVGLTMLSVLAGVGLVELSRYFQQRLRRYRVGQMLHQIEQEAYQGRPKMREEWQTKTDWECGEDRDR